MIRHMVLVRVRQDVAASEIAAIFAELEALKPLVPGFQAFKGGPNVSPEGLARGYTHGFTVDFADAAARDAYLVHEAHQKAGARLVAAAQDGVGGLVVLDIESA
jgi:hypothetical protein